MKKILCLGLFIALLSSNTVQSQDFLKNGQHPINFDAAGLNATSIEKKLTDVGKIYNESEISILENQVDRYNDDITQKIAQIINERQGITSHYNELLEKDKVTDLLTQIKNAENTIREIEMNTKNNLAKIAYRGYYIYVRKNLKAFEKLATNKRIAKNTYTPIAIEDLRGSFLKSIKDYYVDDNTGQNIYKSITQETISGKLQLITELPNLRTDNIFWEVVKVDVFPLQNSSASTSSSGSEANYDNIVIDALKSSTSITSQLRSFGLSSSLVAEIINEVGNEKEEVLIHNQNIKNTEKNYVSDARKSIQELQRTISELKDELDPIHDFYTNFFAEHTNLSYDPENSEESVNNARSYFVDRLETNSAEELRLKGMKLRTKWNETVRANNDPAKEAGETAMRLIEQLNTALGQDEEFTQIKRDDSGEYTETRQIKTTLKREVEHVWIFMEIKGNVYDLSLIATFKTITKSGGKPKTSKFGRPKTKIVTGIITDERGMRFAGADITPKGSSNYGVVSDINGKYSIMARQGSILVFSFPGFYTQEVSVNANTSTVNIAFQPNEQARQIEPITKTEAIAGTVTDGEKEKPAKETKKLRKGSNLSRLAYFSVEGGIRIYKPRESTATNGEETKITSSSSVYGSLMFYPGKFAIGLGVGYDKDYGIGENSVSALLEMRIHFTKAFALYTRLGSTLQSHNAFLIEGGVLFQAKKLYLVLGPQYSTVDNIEETRKVFGVDKTFNKSISQITFGIKVGLRL